MINSQFLKNLIEHPQFKIDTLLPNYLIHSRMHPEDNQTSLDFDLIYGQIQDAMQNVIEIYCRELRQEMVPCKTELSQRIKCHKINQSLRRHVENDCQLLLFSLTRLQDVYTQFLTYYFFQFVEYFNVIDNRVNLSWFDQQLHEITQSHIIKTMGTTSGLLYDLLIRQLNMLPLIHALSTIIADLFNNAAENLKLIVAEFIENTDKTNLSNRYLIMGLFQELSQRSYDLVQNYEDFSIFAYSSFEVREQFAAFVINHFDQLRLFISHNEKDYLSEQQRRLTQLDLDDPDILMKELTLIVQNEEIISHPVEHKVTKQKAILIEVPSSNQAYLIHRPLDKLVILNAKLVPARWRYIPNEKQPEELLKTKQLLESHYSSIERAFHCLKFQARLGELQDEDFDPEKEKISFISCNIMGNEIQSAMSSIEREAGQIVTQSIRPMPISTAAGDIGASLGICLANFNKYSSRKQFLADFGQTAVISGSMTYLITQVPMVGQLVALGGFGYFTMKIYQNEATSQFGKNTQFNKLIIGTTANVGSGLGGAFIGQALIPIPIVGALIGGFIGGLLGGISSSIFLEHMSEKRFEELYIFLSQEYSWQYSPEDLNKLGISEQLFLEQMPSNIKYDENKYTKWLNMVTIYNNQIAYVYITVFKQQLDVIRIKEEKEQSLKNLESPVHDSTSMRNIDEEFPQVIESAIKWIIAEKCLIGYALPKLEFIIKCIFQNL